MGKTCLSFPGYQLKGIQKDYKGRSTRVGKRRCQGGTMGGKKRRVVGQFFSFKSLKNLKGSTINHWGGLGEAKHH